MVVWLQNPFDNLPCEGYRKQRYWMMAEAFVRLGHRVVYWTSDFSHSRKAPRVAVTSAGGIEVVLVPTRPYFRNVSVRRLLSHRAYAAAWTRQAEAFAASRGRPDLIVSSMPTVSAAAAALDLGRAFGAKVVLDVQDAWPETFERIAPKGFRWLARLALSPMRVTARRLYREADVVTGVCDRYRDLTGRADYRRAYLGVELDAAPAPRPAPHGRIRLVYSGNLGRTYDLATVARVVAGHDDLELDVAGFGTDARIVASDRIRFHGMLADADLRALYARCDVGVIPMADESWVGLPNKMFDYSKAGLRIVSSLAGESAALLAKYACGATYRPGDAVSLNAAIRAAAAMDSSRELCEREFEAARIYDGYVLSLTANCP